MYVGFSTLGCPGVSISHVVALAVASGAEIVQLRIAHDEPVNLTMSVAQRDEVRSIFLDNGVTVDSLATYIRLDAPDVVDQTRSHVDLAVGLGVRRLRVFPGNATVDEAAAALAAADAVAADSGVTLAVETHDDHVRSTDVAAILDRSGTAATAVWDILHTTTADETPADSYAALRDRLSELQIKDVDDVRRPVAPGTGVLPVAEAIRTAREGGFTGSIVFEHEAKWHAEADPFGPALAMALRIVRDNW
ncbi:sugar phosphate isomerase/epimerase family protein [Stackebrandtia soli]|uniref:sugar phosphate isomerase/epimerase family protein n=1 Tax=Stackebrandtia soli TaxID=1892856 RepID=UPI0039E8B7CE